MTAVAVNDPASTYWRSIVYIEATFSNGSIFTGSGVMVGPNDVLTASHVLYLPQQGGAATRVRVIPAYDPSPYSAPYGEISSTSFQYFSNYDPQGAGYLLPGDGAATLAWSELDVGIIGLDTGLGYQTGWMEIDPTFTSGTVNVTGFPAAYGRNMMTESGYAATDRIDSTILYSGFDLSPGNSGGPVWTASGGTARVVGVVSTSGWGASVRGTYDQLRQWISSNDSLLPAANPDTGGRDTSSPTPPNDPPPSPPAPAVPDTPENANPPAPQPQTPPPPSSPSPAPAPAPAPSGATTPPEPSLPPVRMGSTGNDHMSGTAAGNRFDAGRGNDVITSSDGGDAIDGGTGVDTAVYGARAGYSVEHVASGITVTNLSTGAVDTLRGVERLQFSDSIMLVDIAPRLPDRNGDGRADMLTRSLDTGTAVAATSNSSGPMAVKATGMSGGLDWNIAGSGDFDGDGRADVLWRQDDGLVAIWSMNGASIVRSGLVGMGPAGASIAGTGDFDGDGRSDILWRSDDGNVGMWEMEDSVIAGAGIIGTLPSDWRIVGVADFNGDGRADILGQSDTGAIAVLLLDGPSRSGGGLVDTTPAEWKIAALGDFDGDGKADILWRHDTGPTSVWLMDGNTIAGGWGPATADPGRSWTIVGTGDFDGDGKDDILWQNLDGELKADLMNGVRTMQTVGIGTLEAGWIIT